MECLAHLKLIDDSFGAAVPRIGRCSSLRLQTEKQIKMCDQRGLEGCISIWRARFCSASTTTASRADRSALQNRMRPPRDAPITAIKADKPATTTIQHRDHHCAIQPDKVLRELRRTWEPIFGNKKTRGRRSPGRSTTTSAETSCAQHRVVFSQSSTKISAAPCRT